MGKSGVSGSIAANNNTYEYSEVAFGSKTRGIRISIKGTASSSYEFKLLPNPHDNPQYNKKQTKFYKEVAENMVQNWPPTAGAVVEGLGVDYTLTAR